MVDVLTLFTDAGFDPARNAGVWAAWAKFRRSDPTLRRSGVLKSVTSPVTCSNTAELQALVNGLSVALRGFSPPSGTAVSISTDSLTAIHALSGGSFKPQAQARFAPMVTLYQRLVAQHELKVRLKHVKGHKSIVLSGTREFVNHWCDGECRKLLRELRGAPDPAPKWEHLI